MTWMTIIDIFAHNESLGEYFKPLPARASLAHEHGCKQLIGQYSACIYSLRQNAVNQHLLALIPCNIDGLHGCLVAIENFI